MTTIQPTQVQQVDWQQLAAQFYPVARRSMASQLLLSVLPGIRR